jgi:hypothetical protein
VGGAEARWPEGDEGPGIEMGLPCARAALTGCAMTLVLRTSSWPGSSGVG